MTALQVGHLFGPQVLANWKGPGGGDYQGGTPPPVPVPTTTTSSPGPGNSPPPSQASSQAPILPTSGFNAAAAPAQTGKTLLGQ